MKDIRTEALNRCYKIEGYKDLPLKEKNKCYDMMKKQIELERLVTDEIENETGKKKTYTYYSRLRPVSIGTYPKNGMIGFKNYDRRKFFVEPGFLAWGEIYYNRPLNEKEIEDYDLATLTNSNT